MAEKAAARKSHSLTTASGLDEISDQCRRELPAAYCNKSVRKTGHHGSCSPANQITSSRITCAHFHGWTLDVKPSNKEKFFKVLIKKQ